MLVITRFFITIFIYISFISPQLYSYRNAIGQLEADRDELYELLQKERQESGQEIQKVKEHMEMQLQQQLKQQLRHVQEHFHQQLHDQQLKLQTMQQTIDEYKQREDLIQADVNDNGINYETLKVAFQQLQVTRTYICYPIVTIGINGFFFSQV